MDVAVASVEGNTSSGDQLAVITDDEVAFSGSFFICILAGCHGNVAVRRGCHAQNVNGSQAGLQGNVLFRRDRLVILHVIGADVDIAFARLHRYVCILGFDGFGNEDAACIGNGRDNIAGSGNNVAAQHDIAALLHIEDGRMPRNERGLPIRSRVISLFNAFRQSSDINAVALFRRDGIRRLNDNVIPRLQALVVPVCIVNRFPGCHTDIVARRHAPAYAEEGTCRRGNRNVMGRVGISQQIHVAVGSQHKVSFSAVPPKDMYFFILIIRMQYQYSQVTIRGEIGKLRIPANACPQTHYETIVFASGVIGHSLNTAVNLLAAIQGVSQEVPKHIVLAFHGHAFSAVSFHHRRVNFHARGFLNGAARMDDKGIVRFYHFGHIIVVSIF